MLHKRGVGFHIGMGSKALTACILLWGLVILCMFPKPLPVDQMSLVEMINKTEDCPSIQTVSVSIATPALGGDVERDGMGRYFASVARQTMAPKEVREIPAVQDETTANDNGSNPDHRWWWS
jgi:hypothetical protein